MSFFFDHYKDTLGTDGTPGYTFYVLGTMQSNNTTTGVKLTPKNGGIIVGHASPFSVTLADGVVVGVDAAGNSRSFVISNVPAPATASTGLVGILGTLNKVLTASSSGNTTNDLATSGWSVSVVASADGAETVITCKGGTSANPVKWGGFLRTLYVN